MYIYVHMHISLSLYIYIYLSISIYLSLSLCIHIYIYISISIMCSSPPWTSRSCMSQRRLVFLSLSFSFFFFCNYFSCLFNAVLLFFFFFTKCALFPSFPVRLFYIISFLHCFLLLGSFVYDNFFKMNYESCNSGNM